jgi:hypothetical protein
MSDIYIGLLWGCTMLLLISIQIRIDKMIDLLSSKS